MAEKSEPAVEAAAADEQRAAQSGEATAQTAVTPLVGDAPHVDAAAEPAATAPVTTQDVEAPTDLDAPEGTALVDEGEDSAGDEQGGDEGAADGDADDEPIDEDDYREEKVVVVRRGVFYAVAAVAILAIAVLAGLNVYQKAKSNDPAVATVNGAKIPRSQYDKIIARTDNGAGQTEGLAVVDQLINTTLLEQDAAKNHVTASPDEIDAELKKQKANFSTDAAYQAALSQAHLTEPELRAQLKDQVLLQKLVLNNVTVSDAEVAQEYNQNKDTTYQGKQLSDVQAQIKTTLLQQKQQTAEQTYFDNLQAKAKISRHVPGA